MKILKFEGGGFAGFTPIIETMPTPATAPATTTAEKSATSILDDDTFKELLTKGGLVNDVNSLVSELINLETSETNPFLKKSNRSMAIRMLGKVNELRQNKALWDDSIKTAATSGALGEVAVGSSGELFIKDNNNNAKAVSISDFTKHQ